MRITLTLLLVASVALASVEAHRRRNSQNHNNSHNYAWLESWSGDTRCDSTGDRSACGGLKVSTRREAWRYDETDKCRPPTITRSDECTCVAREECPAGADEASVSVIVRRGRRSLPGLIDAILGGSEFDNQRTRNGGHHDHVDPYHSIFSGVFPGGIAVDVNRNPFGGFFGGNRGVNVRIPGILDIGVNRRRPPFIPPSNDEREECATCGGPVPSPRPTRRRVATPSPSKCQPGQVCCRLSRADQNPSQASVPPSGSCGKRSACGVEPSRSKQPKGESNVGEYPWVAMILHVAPSGRKEFLCNGALIDQRRIATVAQCVESFERNPSQIEIRLGEFDAESENEVNRHEDHPVDSIYIHPRYDNVTLTNDIAIVTLGDTVQNKIHISPVCLPSDRERFEARSCVVTGWGNRQPVLKEFYVECLGDDECIRRLRESKLGAYYHLHHSFFCAQSRDQSSCLIDGGGPLVCRRKDDSYAIIGLLSWSVDEYSPDVYVRLQNFLDFLSEARSVTTVSVDTSGTFRTPKESVSTSTTTTSASTTVEATTVSEVSQPQPVEPSPAPIPPQEHSLVENEDSNFDHPPNQKPYHIKPHKTPAEFIRDMEN